MSYKEWTLNTYLLNEWRKQGEKEHFQAGFSTEEFLKDEMWAQSSRMAEIWKNEEKIRNIPDKE